MPFKLHNVSQQEDTVANGATLDTDFVVSDDITFDEKIEVTVVVRGIAGTKNSVAFAIGGGALVGGNVMEMTTISTYIILARPVPQTANRIRVHLDNGSGGVLIYNTTVKEFRRV